MLGFLNALSVLSLPTTLILSGIRSVGIIFAVGIIL
jgi:hypothetical protein